MTVGLLFYGGIMSEEVIVLTDIDAVKAFLTDGDDDSIQEVIFTQGDINNGETE